MPQGRKELREKFMSNNTDGIEDAEKIITSYGGTVGANAMITIELDYDKFMKTHTEDQWVELNDAVEYLLTEWDYGLDEIVND